MDNRFQILSLDGGGLKGIFVASFLAAIEENTGKKIIDHFDLIAGTSTGGIIALGLGLGYQPKEILGFYKEKGAIIFPAQNWIARAFVNVKGFFKRKYSSKPLEKALKDYFGNKTLCDSKKPLIIPSFESVRGDVYIYKTPHHKNLRCDYKVPIYKIALATSSAPTYFPASITDAGVRLIDGGIWANNPGMVALTEALGYLKQSQIDVAMLSIGATREVVASEKAHIKGGMWTWRKKALEFMMLGQSLSSENQALHILGKDRFLRVNPIVPGKYTLDKMTDELEGIGHSEARKQLNVIDKMFFEHVAKPYKPIYTIEK